jgi:hypothetical protein
LLKVKENLNITSRWMLFQMFCTQGIIEELGVSMSVLNKFISNLDTVATWEVSK